MEWAWSVEGRATRRFPFAGIASSCTGVRGGCAVIHVQPEAEDGVHASAARTLRVESAGCGGQPRLEAPDPSIELLHLGGSVSACHPARQSAAGRSPSMRSWRCCSGRGRWRQSECVGNDGLGGAQHRGEQRRQVEVALSCGAYRRWRGPAGCRRPFGCGCIQAKPDNRFGQVAVELHLKTVGRGRRGDGRCPVRRPGARRRRRRARFALECGRLRDGLKPGRPGQRAGAAVPGNIDRAAGARHVVGEENRQCNLRSQPSVCC